MMGLLPAGCGGAAPAAAPPTSTTSSAVTTSSTTTTAPQRPTSTTTTAYDPASVKGAVEAAYLRSWDVYADAVYNLRLDEAALVEVYAGKHLETKREEITGRIADGRAALVRVDHNYTVDIVDPSSALVIDRYRNHQVLIDRATKEPTEVDPNQTINDVVTLKLISGAWKVTLKERAGA